MIPVDQSPFAIFTFLVAPAILTNASTLLALGTSNRLARGVDRQRAIASALLIDETFGKAPSPIITPELAQEQFAPSARRVRVLIRALRAFYLAIGSFAGGTCIAMFGAIAGYFENERMANVGLIAMLLIAGVGVVAIVFGSICLVSETTETLGLLEAEERLIRKAIDARKLSS